MGKRIPKYVAYHEAGHVLAYIRFKHPFDRVELSADDPEYRGLVRGGSTFYYERHKRVPLRDRRHEALIHLAGPLAEYRFQRRAWWHWHDDLAETDDFDRAYEIAGNDRIDRWVNETIRLVRRWWPMITVVAEALYAEIEDGHALLYPERVTAILRAHMAKPQLAK
jgi:hypothetical protein